VGFGGLDSFAVYDEAGAGFQVGAVLGALLLLGREGEDGFVEDDLVDVALEVVDAGLQGADLVGEGEDDVGEWVVDLAGVGDENALAGLVDDVGGDADDGGVRGDVAEDDGAGADAGVFADGDVAEDVGGVADEDVVAEGGVALAADLASATESNALVDRDVVPDDGGFANDDTHAVVDEEAAADDGAGVDLDAGPEAGDLGHEAGEELEAPAPEPMIDAMNPDGLEAGIAEQDHEARGCGGISFEDAARVFADVFEEVHGWVDDSAGGLWGGLGVSTADRGVDENAVFREARHHFLQADFPFLILGRRAHWRFCTH
jgi:hypothetical protein